jgi:hypothetical protein
MRGPIVPLTLEGVVDGLARTGFAPIATLAPKLLWSKKK